MKKQMKELMTVLLPRLARPLYDQLQRYRSGKLDENRFTRSFEALLQREHIWLTKQGIAPVHAALAIHSAVLVLSTPGLKAEAEEAGLPLEILEHKAVLEAANDVSQNYGLDEQKAGRVIASMVAHYI